MEEDNSNFVEQDENMYNLKLEHGDWRDHATQTNQDLGPLNFLESDVNQEISIQNGKKTSSFLSSIDD